MALINKGNYLYGFWVGLGVLGALFVWNIIDRKVLSQTKLGS